MQGSQWVALGVVLGALAGCASTPDSTPPGQAAESSLALVDSQSAFGYEAPDWKTPFWERLADKFASRSDARTTETPATTATPASAQPASSQGEDAEPAAPPARASSTPSPAPSSTVAPYGGTPAIASAPAGAAVASSVEAATAGSRGLRPTVALAWLGESGNAPAVLDRLAADLGGAGISIIGPAALADAVANAPDCRPVTQAACLATIARYPGARVLVAAEPGDGSRVRLTSYDTSFAYQYPTTEVAANAQTFDDQETALRRRLSIAPWFTRYFSAQDGRYYLPAGRAAGLAVGDRLAVHDNSRLVRSPSGQPVAWQPGPSDGALEITALLGADTSVAEPVAGAGPVPAQAFLVAPE